MSNTNDNDQQATNSSRKPSQRLSRRRILLTSGLGIAGLATGIVAETVQANTQKPVTPEVGRANPNGKFAGKVVLITGATSGIGEATARAFAKEGASVHFCGRREALGEQIARSIRETGGKATYQRADVRVENDVKAFVDNCVQRYGRLDIAFNNAGIFMTPAELQDIPLDNFLDIIRTNTVGEFLSMKYEIPYMRRQGGGAIINMASVSGHAGFPRMTHYAASKHGIVGMTKIAAIENADHNIRVNSISPLAVDTPQLRESVSFFRSNYEEAVKTMVTKRIMTTEEMARAVMFLASDEATSMTGMDLDVTGGHLAR
ncbi:SDR family NAD(P)-dependent oxidoreductase [Leptolyngbya sp. FACHB-261]|uniref:SDR family NAD(P)-dependent oxidoreductase n=1 Tax=Leptolyngbya sp. FACHB-261 TaxID=2692806 RepID=UPI0016859249|nr:SDR family oxidoreductase [Leptolyngbya sp. FACHB-261]MBD2103520.1 SDR family oxidoreductase [Leptolyngbya sp. FACHB-261]